MHGRARSKNSLHLKDAIKGKQAIQALKHLSDRMLVVSFFWYYIDIKRSQRRSDLA